jgi:phospholipase/carboxylesterase
MHIKNIITTGKPINEARKALIMVHGRGAGANDILELASHLNVEEYALFAPQATNNTWYPGSFLLPVEQNEPWLSSALALLEETIQDIRKQGIEYENIYFLGFSQGACLVLEYVTRNARKYGGIAAFTGGLQGETIDESNYNGDFEGTRVFIGTGDPDPHVPVERVNRTAAIMNNLNAAVRVEVYKNKPHNVSPDEIDQANSLIFN